MGLSFLWMLSLGHFAIIQGGSEWHDESLGCFYDKAGTRPLPIQGFDQKYVDRLTIGKCINACRGKGERFAGVEFSNQCFCGDVFPNQGSASSQGKTCNNSCEGNSEEICGGGNALSVYTVCKNGTYGQKNSESYSDYTCPNTCHNCTIKDPPCHPATGVCRSGGCQGDWKGTKCDLRCDSGKYGLNCEKSCNGCNGSSCNHIDGICSDGCLKEWIGPKCDQRLTTTTYAANEQTMSMKTQTSTTTKENRNVGTTAFGSTFSTPENHPETNSLGQTTAVAPISDNLLPISILIPIIVGVVLFVCILICVIIIVKRKKKRTDISPATDGNLLYANVSKTNTARTMQPLTESAVTPQMSRPALPAKTPPKNPKFEMENDDVTYDNYSLTRPIKIEDLEQYIKNKHAEKNGFQDEFKSIPTGKTAEWTIATKKMTLKAKNLFKNVYAYDHSRVKLSQKDENDSSDYINASYINGYQKNTKFIATQNPSNTMPDFWRMVWEQEVTIIVTLTTLLERGRGAVTQYWPDEGESLMAGIYMITSQKEEVFQGHVIRTLQISQSNDNSAVYGNLSSDSRTIHQFHYTDWPDKDVPTDGMVMVSFLRKVKAFSKRIKTPIVVHCRAGIGRTGAYLALDYLLDQAAAEGIVDVYKCVNLMREDRTNMVQTPPQYIFIYESLCEALAVGDTGIPAQDFQSIFKKLQAPEPGKREPRIQTQYKVLKRLSQALIKKGRYTEAAKEENLSKNRTDTNYPDNSYRAILMTPVPGRTDYINAVHANGYGEKRDELLLTQLPLVDTVVDFWRMVYGHNANTIVMLTSSQSNNFRESNYCPIHVGLIEKGPFTISKKKQSTERNVMTYKLQLDYRDETRTILVVEGLCWPEDENLPKNMTTLQEIYKKVEAWKKEQSQGGKTVIQCFDGCIKSGMYTITSCLFDMIQREEVVDIYQTTKQLLKTRPSFLKNMEQYVALHRVVEDYVGNSAIYSQVVPKKNRKT